MYGGLETMRSKRSLRGQIVEQIAEADVDAAAEAEARRVAARHLHGGLAHVGGHQTHERVLGRQGERDAAGAGAHIERQRLVAAGGRVALVAGTAASASRATSTSVSVSGRGISTAGVTSSSMARKARRPRM